MALKKCTHMYSIVLIKQHSVGQGAAGNQRLWLWQKHKWIRSLQSQVQAGRTRSAALRAHMVYVVTAAGNGTVKSDGFSGDSVCERDDDMKSLCMQKWKRWTFHHRSLAEHKEETQSEDQSLAAAGWVKRSCHDFIGLLFQRNSTMFLIMRHVSVQWPSGESASTKWSGRTQGGRRRCTVKPEHFPEKLVCVQIVALRFRAVLFSSSPVSGFGVNTSSSLEL